MSITLDESNIISFQTDYNVNHRVLIEFMAYSWRLISIGHFDDKICVNFTADALRADKFQSLFRIMEEDKDAAYYRFISKANWSRLPNMQGAYFGMTKPLKEYSKDYPFLSATQRPVLADDKEGRSLLRSCHSIATVVFGYPNVPISYSAPTLERVFL